MALFGHNGAYYTAQKLASLEKPTFAEGDPPSYELDVILTKIHTGSELPKDWVALTNPRSEYHFLSCTNAQP